MNIFKYHDAFCARVTQNHHLAYAARVSCCPCADQSQRALCAPNHVLCGDL